MRNRPKVPKPPARPTPAPGVPVPQAYTGPSRNLQAMAQSIGANKALSEFYSALVREQWEYDNDYRQNAFDMQRDSARHDQEIDIQNNREWLKTGEVGRGMPSYTSFSSDGKESATERVAASQRNSERSKGSSINAFESSHPDMGIDAVDPDKVDAELSKVKAKAEKKAESDEAERDWWGKVAGGISEGFDAVTPDAVIDGIAGGAKMVANSPVGERVGDAGGWAFKQLSRPGHAIASATDAYYGLDEDDPRTNARDGSSLFGKSDNFLSAVGNMALDNLSWFGASDSASLDELDVEGLKKIGSAFKEGWSLENDTTFSDVIKHNAERNPAFTIHDTLTYQTGGGIASDIVLDPLNAFGMGVATRPIQLARETKRLKNIQSLADDIAGLNVPKIGPAKQGENFNYSADEIVDLLGGGRRYANRTEATRDAKRVQANVETLDKAINNATGPSTSRGVALRKAGERVRAQLDAEKSRFASEVVTESAIKRAEHAERTGDLPVGAAKAFTRRVEQQRIVRAFGAAKYKDVDEFNKALGDDWLNHPALSDDDRLALWTSNRKLTKKAYPAEASKNQALVQRYTDMKREYQNAKGPEAKAQYKEAMDRAEVALKRHNKKFNRLRATTFMRQARAKINQNIGTRGKDARYLKAVQKQAADELESLNVTPYDGDLFDIANREDFLSAGSHVGTSDDMVKQVDLPEGEFPQIDDLTASNLWDTDASKFGSRVQQLQAIHSQATRELDSLYPAMVGEDALDMPLMDIPAEFETPFGDLDPTTIQSKLTIDEKSLTASVDDSVPPGPSRDWLEDFVDAFNDEFGEEFSRLNQKEQRAANETAQRKGEAEVLVEDIQNLIKAGDEDAKHFAEIFRNPDGSVPDGSSAANRNAYPSFEHKGKRIFQNSKELAKMVDAPAVSRSDKMLKFIEDPSKLTEKDAQYVFDRLKEFGLPVVNHPEAIFNYLSNNNIALRDMFQPKNISFAMNFKKKHGIPLEEANELRAYLLGNTVKAGKGYEKTRWSRNYPKGISKARFLHEVTGASGGNALKHVLDGAPFRISPKADELGFKSPITRPMSEGGWKGLSEKEFEKALDEAGMPKDSTLAEVEAQWYDDMHTYLNGLDSAKLKNKLTGIWESSHKKQVTARKREIVDRSLGNREIAGAANRRINVEKARDTAFDKVAMNIEKGQQVSRQGGSIHLPESLDELDTAKSIVAAKREEMLEQVDETREALQEAKRIHDTPEIARLEKRLNRLRKAYSLEKAAVRSDLKKAREAKEVMKKRLREEAILNTANAELIAKNKGLAFNALGRELMIPGTRTMFAAAERAGGLPVIKKFFDTYKESFASQANMLPDDMLLMRNRAISHTSKVISTHIRNLKDTLGQIPLKARAAATRDFANGIDNETTRMIGSHMEDLLPFFQNSKKVGDGVLTIREINAYLPEHFRVSDREYTNPRQVLTELMGDKSGKIDLKRDPVEAIWTARIAIEQAMARRALVHSLNETFGIRRGFPINRKTGAIVSKKNRGPAADTIERLNDEGWKTVKDLGHTYYFPPETAEDISRLLKMFEPINAGRVGKFIDEVTGIWKTSVTIYNIPGYYIRNGIGETMSAWLAGVNSVKPYYKSAEVWRYTSKQTKDAEALATMRPDLNLNVETADKIGKKHAVTLQNGTNVNIADLHAWYADQGLSTGFINTEYRHHYNKTKERLHRVPGVQRLSNANEGLREFNENYEDFYRMAHFIDKLGKAPSSMSNQAAAEWAAKSVRKYHFDYTDFTKAEKVAMLRIFPFYKWTRKALPLMSSMMFVKPGKMMVYPKVMEGVSESLVASDDLSPGVDHNGFMPNYYGIVPSSIAEMWAYQVSGETGPDAEGTQGYFRMQTPQMDSMGVLSHPEETAQGLLNPMLKGLIEQIKGETLGMGLPVANADDTVEEEDGRLINNRWSHLLNMFPPGAVATKMDRGDMDSDALIRLLTGMGYNEVSDEYRRMEQVRRSE